MHDLLLLRHAQAGLVVAGVDDRARTLSAHGEAQAHAVGHWLAGQGLYPDSVVCSTARRARATAALVLAAWPASPPVMYLDAVYGATSDELLGLLHRHGHGERVLLIGHNPGLQHLVPILCADAPADRALPPAGLAHIVLDGVLAPGNGRLVTFRSG